MKVQGTYSKSVEVKISAKEVLGEILDGMLRLIKPETNKAYDDWYIKDGNVIGVIEHYHGSDTNEIICKASEDLIESYNAIMKMKQLKTTYGSKIEKFL